MNNPQLGLEDRLKLGLLPEVGDHVVVTDQGDGWRMELTGEVSDIDAWNITIGNGYSVDLEGLKIQAYPILQERPSSNYLWNQNAALRENNDELSARIGRAERRCDNLRMALRASGTPDGIVALIEGE